MIALAHRILGRVNKRLCNASITAKDISIKKIINGSVSRLDYLKGQINQLELEKNTLLINGRYHKERPIWIGASDVFVLSGLNESNLTVMFEAIGCEKPFVEPKVGRMLEVKTFKKNYGLLVEPVDPYDSVEKIPLAPEREWDQNIILGYAEMYTLENITKEIEAHYNQVLG
jgi:glycosyltransferase involved in cell wall biosynthesis